MAQPLTALPSSDPGKGSNADTGLLPATAYYYRLISFNEVGSSAPSWLVTATTGPQAVAYSGPIIITQGGVYTGNWESLDVNVPTVTVRTAEPVVIEKSNIRGRGDLIEMDAGHTRVTVRDTAGTA